MKMLDDVEVLLQNIKESDYQRIKAIDDVLQKLREGKDSKIDMTLDKKPVDANTLIFDHKDWAPSKTKPLWPGRTIFFKKLLPLYNWLVQNGYTRLHYKNPSDGWEYWAYDKSICKIKGGDA